MHKILAFAAVFNYIPIFATADTVVATATARYSEEAGCTLSGCSLGTGLELQLQQSVIDTPPPHPVAPAELCAGKFPGALVSTYVQQNGGPGAVATAMQCPNTATILGAEQ